MPTVTGKERARGENDERARDGKAEYEIPGRSGGVEALRKVMPEPVLQLGDDCDEQRGE